MLYTNTKFQANSEAIFQLSMQTIYCKSNPNSVSFLPENGGLLGVHADGVLLVRVLKVPQSVGLDVAAAAQYAAGDAQPHGLGGVAS